jgi:hypothetical protein
MTTLTADHRVMNAQFHDLTPDSYSVPHSLKRLLGKHLKFCPTPPHPTSDYIKNCIANFKRRIRLLWQFRHQSKQEYNRKLYVPVPEFQPAPAHPTIEHQLALIQHSHLLCNSPVKYNLLRKQQQLCRNFRSQNTLKLVFTDKNLGPALMLYDDYVAKAFVHLQDKAIYQQVPDIPLRSLRNEVHAFYKRLIRIAPAQAQNARIIIANLDTTTPNYFHWLPKIHKSPMGLRPIISGINGPTTGLAKWLDYQLQTYMQNQPSYVPDSQSIVHHLQDIRWTPGTSMYSLDAESLYTSIPLDVALRVVDCFLITSPLRHAIIAGLRIVLYNNWFVFNDQYFRQVQGIAMGSPISVAVANLYLAWFEKDIIPRFRQICTYRRYIDDTLVIWTDDATDPFAWNRFMANFQRIPGIHWTCVAASPSPMSITFLDLEIFVINDRFQTRTFQKSLNLYLYNLHTSAHPPGTIKSLIFGQLRRYYKQNSLVDDFLHIRKLFYERLRARGYPVRLLQGIFRKFDAPLATSSSYVTSGTHTNTVPLILPYDPNGHSPRRIRTLLRIHDLQQICARLRIPVRVMIVHRRPPNLATILMASNRSRTPSADDPKLQQVEAPPNSPVAKKRRIF